MSEIADTVIEAFVRRWERSGAAERANYQLFLTELCDIIGVPRPEPAGADDTGNAYVFERGVEFRHGDGSTSTGRMDLYKRRCLVLEAKQGANEPAAPANPLSDAVREQKRKLKAGTARRGTAAWDDAMLRARSQAELYARALPPAEGRPPFLVVADVGHSIELYAEFSCTGGTYIPFPAPGTHRIFLRDLERPDLRERLRMVWTDPDSVHVPRASPNSCSGSVPCNGISGPAARSSRPSRSSVTSAIFNAKMRSLTTTVSRLCSTTPGHRSRVGMDAPPSRTP